MSISLLLEMAASHDPERIALVDDTHRWTVRGLSDLADGGTGAIQETDVEHVVYLGAGGAILPLLLFASARAGKAFTPINYRLSSAGIEALLSRLPTSLLVVDTRYREAVTTRSHRIVESDDFIVSAATVRAGHAPTEADEVSVVLFTSGTTSAPKAVELTHHNLTSYVMGTVDFASAQPADAALICVPPYHIAGVSAALSNIYAGRKMVYQPVFDAAEWVGLVQRESVTTATVVPTMLDRILTVLEQDDSVDLPSLRTLAYGGSRVPLPLVRQAMNLLPDVGFVNAYGLTETSSTIAVLTPQDHRDAHVASDPGVARRLASVGRTVPGVETQIRDAVGNPLGPGETGELYVRGEQVSGRYTGIGSVLDEDGWFPTKDRAFIDQDGYLFIRGRQDDTIIRGGENIAPAEIEDVLIEHPDVYAVAVVGVQDAQWGQSIVAVVVPEAGSAPDPERLRDHVRAALRGSRTPDRVVFFAELPTTATGKVLRREIAATLEHSSDQEAARA